VPVERAPRAENDGRALVRTLGAIQILLGIGGSAIIPLLPTYLVDHGSTPAGVGLVMGSFYFAQLLGQYPAGRIVDRIGFRPVVVSGLVIFAVGCVGFAFVHDPAIGIAFRALQGLGDGAFTIAGAAAIGVAVPADDRGRAFTVFNSSLMLSFAIGPMIGGAVGTSSIRALFLGAGGLAIVATSVASFLPRVAVGEAGLAVGSVGGALDRRRVLSWALVGAALAFGATGVLSGLYDGVWSLLLRSRGVSTLGISFSWTLYCLPYVAMTPLAARVVTRVDRRFLVCASIVCSALLASIYPEIASGTVLVFIGAIEGVTAVFMLPSAQSILSEHVSEHLQGSAQGIAGSVRTAAMAVGAYGSGVLFGVDRGLPFRAASGVLVLVAIGVAATWRSVAGRTDRPAAPLTVPSGPPG